MEIHSLFSDDLKVPGKSHKILKDVKEIIKQASLNNGACYWAGQCVAIMLQKAEMVRVKMLQL